VREPQCDLVIKAPAGNHPMRRWTFTSNDWKLANECPVPLLLVRDAAWNEPPRFAAAVDMADEEDSSIARGILRVSAFLTLGCRATLDILYCEREQRHEPGSVARSMRLAELVREHPAGRERIQLHFGMPEKILPPTLAALRYDVLVLGAGRQDGGFKGRFGGMTSRLVEATRGDVLLVKADDGPVARRSHEMPALREQRSQQALR
jgi:universal stress protein E